MAARRLAGFIALALAVLAAVASSGEKAAAVQAISIEQNGPQPSNRIVRINYDANTQVVVDLEANVRSILSGAERNDPTIVAQRVQDYLQMLVDDNVPGGPLAGRSLITAWDPEDPARISDPAEPGFFWARDAGDIGTGPSRIDLYRPTALVGGVATHIIARPFLVIVTFNGSEFVIQTQEPPQSLR